jgi:hypothetical protein
MLDRSELTSEANGDSMDRSLKISSDCFSLGSFWNSSKVIMLEAMVLPSLLSCR